MRARIVILVLLSVATASAQEQERKLIDRLLKPDMSLTNPAQTKTFTAAREATTKSVKPRSFYTGNKIATREFPARQSFFSRVFGTRKFNRGAESAHIGNTAVADGAKSFATQSSPDAREFNESGKAVPTTDYAGNRTFVPNGKSQKSLSTQDTPMTIDQVRELLNRNK